MLSLSLQNNVLLIHLSCNCGGCSGDSSSTNSAVMSAASSSSTGVTGSLLFISVVSLPAAMWPCTRSLADVCSLYQLWHRLQGNHSALWQQYPRQSCRTYKIPSMSLAVIALEDMRLAGENCLISRNSSIFSWENLSLNCNSNTSKLRITTSILNAVSTTLIRSSSAHNSGSCVGSLKVNKQWVILMDRRARYYLRKNLRMNQVNGTNTDTVE